MLQSHDLDHVVHVGSMLATDVLINHRSWRSCEKAENSISGGGGDFWRHVERVQKKSLGGGEKLEGRGWARVGERL